MPSRIIREGFVDSESVCALTDWAHRVYSNLLLKADDAGRFDGRLEFLRSHLFPLGTQRRSSEVEQAVIETEKHALLIRYHFASKPYLQLTRWHRTGSSHKSKFPWRDGTLEISYVMLDTKDGPKEFVFSSVPTGSAPPPDPLRTPPNNEIRNTNNEHRIANPESEGDCEGGPAVQHFPEVAIGPQPRRPFPPGTGATVAFLRAEIAKAYQRDPLISWPYDEDDALLQLCRNPGAEKEWYEILAYHSKEPRYKRQTVLSLLQNWRGELDKARSYDARNKPSKPDDRQRQEVLHAPKLTI